MATEGYSVSKTKREYESCKKMFLVGRGSGRGEPRMDMIKVIIYIYIILNE